MAMAKTHDGVEIESGMTLRPVGLEPGYALLPSIIVSRVENDKWWHALGPGVLYFSTKLTALQYRYLRLLDDVNTAEADIEREFGFPQVTQTKIKASPLATLKRCEQLP